MVNLFALIYLTLVIGVDEATAGLMYGALIVFSVPMPLIAGWLSDRVGRKPLIIVAYLGGAAGFAVFLLAGDSMAGLWLGHRDHGPVLVRRVAPAPGAPRRHRATERPGTPRTPCTSRWPSGSGRCGRRVYGIVIDRLGEPTGVPLVFVLMGVAFIAAAFTTLPIRTEGRPSDRLRRRSRPSRRPVVSSAGSVKRAPSVGAWRSLVARIVRDDEVGGSNPLAPTRPTSSSSCSSD